MTEALDNKIEILNNALRDAPELDAIIVVGVRKGETDDIKAALPITVGVDGNAWALACGVNALLGTLAQFDGFSGALAMALSQTKSEIVSGDLSAERPAEA